MTKKSDARRRVIKIILALLIVILAFAIAGWLLPQLIDLSGYVQAVIECVSILFAVLMLRDEMSETQRLQEAEFITSLNDKFLENEECKKVFAYAIYEANAQNLKALEEGAQSGAAPINEEERQRLLRVVENKPEEPAQIDLSGYLTFFESIFLLLKGKVISWDVVNELFKYRFFACVHSDFIQKERLVRLPMNFKNIYYLEALWMQYNDYDEAQIARFGNRLKASCERAGKTAEYEAILREMEEKHHMLEEMSEEHPRRNDV